MTCVEMCCPTSAAAQSGFQRLATDKVLRAPRTVATPSHFRLDDDDDLASPRSSAARPEVARSQRRESILRLRQDLKTSLAVGKGAAETDLEEDVSAPGSVEDNL